MVLVLIEVLMVVAVGGTLVSAILRVLRRRVPVPTCGRCGAVVSRAYPRCRNCGAGRGSAP